MTTTTDSSPTRPTVTGRLSYWATSQLPLHILIFLLPWIGLYEIGLVSVLTSDAGTTTNKAHASMLQLFEAFGIVQPGGIAIIVVLLAWHFLKRDPWKIRPSVVGGMALESMILACPLLALGWVLSSQVPAAGTPVDIHTLGLWQQVMISIGAGLYEELVFRMLAIAVLHTLLVDLCRASHGLGVAISITVAAAAFTWYHPLANADGDLSIRKLLVYFAAGIYFGVLYVTRGFGIVVGAHALYDVVTVVLNETRLP